MNRRGFFGAALGAIASAKAMLGLKPAPLPTPETIVVEGPQTFLRGDIITFESVYSVNPMTRSSTGMLKHFVVTADVEGGDGAEIEIYPMPLDHGPYQNVTRLPDGVPIHSPVNPRVHKSVMRNINA